MTPTETLPIRLERFLRTGAGEFGALALELFAYQFERNKPYQAFCKAQHKTPQAVERWQDIPAVPIRSFKSVTLATFTPALAAAEFHSSTTTTGTPSRHYVKELRYYETALRTQFEKFVARHIPAGSPYFILTPTPGEAPHSSLVWMFDVVRRKWGAPGSDFFVQRGRLDDWKFSRALQTVIAANQPIALLGTTLAILSFLEKSDQAFPLPNGSLMVDTGGMKASGRDVSREAFLALVAQRLALPESRCINEYGMCELGSQFYGIGATTELEGPAWVRTRAMDLSGTGDAERGKPGLLCHYDLANVDSVLAIQTEDLGILLSQENAAPKFSFQGRASAAELRGCALLTSRL